MNHFTDYNGEPMRTGYAGPGSVDPIDEDAAPPSRDPITGDWLPDVDDALCAHFGIKPYGDYGFEVDVCGHQVLFYRQHGDRLRQRNYEWATGWCGDFEERYGVTPAATRPPALHTVNGRFDAAIQSAIDADLAVRVLSDTNTADELRQADEQLQLAIEELAVQRGRVRDALRLKLQEVKL